MRLTFRGRLGTPGVIVCLAVVSLGCGALMPLEAQNSLPSWRSLSAQCQVKDLGSGKAEEILAMLKAQPPSLAGLAEAITSCENREKELRRQEDQIWVSALGAKNKWDCPDARRQFEKLEKSATFYQAQANVEMRRLGNCGERAIAAPSPETSLERAGNYYRIGEFAQAREMAWKFVLLSNSVGEQARGLLETIEQTEKINRILGQAQTALRAGRDSEACSLLIRIEEDNKTFPNMAEVKSRISAAGCRAPRQVASVSAASKKTDFEKKLDTARVQLHQGNLELARDYLSAAEVLFPNDPACRELRQATQSAKEFRDALEKSLSLIYYSKNLEALEHLRNVLAMNPTSEALAARAHFYMGVAMAKQFYIFDDSKLLDSAKLEFSISVNGYPVPDFENLNPKIKDIYDQAARSRGTGRAL